MKDTSSGEFSGFQAEQQAFFYPPPQWVGVAPQQHYIQRQYQLPMNANTQVMGYVADSLRRIPPGNYLQTILGSPGPMAQAEISVIDNQQDHMRSNHNQQKIHQFSKKRGRNRTYNNQTANHDRRGMSLSKPATFNRNFRGRGGRNSHYQPAKTLGSQNYNRTQIPSTQYSFQNTNSSLYGPGGLAQQFNRTIQGPVDMSNDAQREAEGYDARFLAHDSSGELTDQNIQFYNDDQFFTQYSNGEQYYVDFANSPTQQSFGKSKTPQTHGQKLSMASSINNQSLRSKLNSQLEEEPAILAASGPTRKTIVTQPPKKWSMVPQENIVSRLKREDKEWGLDPQMLPVTSYQARQLSLLKPNQFTIVPRENAIKAVNVKIFQQASLNMRRPNFSTIQPVRRQHHGKSNYKIQQQLSELATAKYTTHHGGTDSASNTLTNNFFHQSKSSLNTSFHRNSRPQIRNLHNSRTMKSKLHSAKPGGLVLHNPSNPHLNVSLKKPLRNEMALSPQSTSAAVGQQFAGAYTVEEAHRSPVQEAELA